jgi:hypothetical protein
MKTSIFSFVALAALCLSSCQREGDCQEMETQKQLSISASIGGVTRASATSKSAWETGDRLGVFVLSDGGGFASPYHGASEYLNAPFTFSAGAWTSAKITLDNRKGDVYAYYPYNSTSTDGSAIPVESASQTDYLWAKSASKVSVYNTHISLNMQHALTQVVFRMKRESYTGGEGRLSRVEIGNHGSAKALQTSGSLNLATGGISGTAEGSVILTADHLVEASESVFAAIVLPVTATTGEDLKVVFTIDGKDYYHVFAAGTAWTPGYRNIYSFTLKDNHLVIGGGDGDGGGEEGGDGGSGTGNTGGALIEPWTDSSRDMILLIPAV